MQKIQLKNIFGEVVNCYVSNISDKGYWYLKKYYNFDDICCWWSGNYTVHEYRRGDGRRIAVAQLNNR